MPKETTMPDHKIGTRKEWQAARDELAKLEAEHTKLGQQATEQRRQLPWVPVEKEYQFDTEDGKKTLAEPFDGRSQLLAHNITFGPASRLGAPPACRWIGSSPTGSGWGGISPTSRPTGRSFRSTSGSHSRPSRRGRSQR